MDLLYSEIGQIRRGAGGRYREIQNLFLNLLTCDAY